MQTPLENWHAHNFLHAPCDFIFVVSLQGTCTKKELYHCNFLAQVTILKWEMIREKWHPNNYGTSTCVSLSTYVPRVKYVSSKYNLCDSCLSSACTAWLSRWTRRALLNMVRVLVFWRSVVVTSGGSMRVQLGEIIYKHNVSNHFQNTDQPCRKRRILTIWINI
jgi:hypothetical protein